MTTLTTNSAMTPEKAAEIADKIFRIRMEIFEMLPTDNRAMMARLSAVDNCLVQAQAGMNYLHADQVVGPLDMA